MPLPFKPGPEADMEPQILQRLVTTASSPLMSPIHDRMPALLRPEEMQEWLTGSGRWDFQPFSGPLLVAPCESPLARRRPGVEQQELF